MLGRDYTASLKGCFQAKTCIEKIPEAVMADSTRVVPRAPRIVRARVEHLPELARLFDLYRQFYEQPADRRLARRFIEENIRKERAVIFLALAGDDCALGFTQLYPTWCSVATRPVWILYDLFVDPCARQGGVGRALMQAAERMARKSKASRIDLETAVDNSKAQALYESLGYEREQEFYKYSLELE
jgi:ribosomal protein S18 acetylase RimI-like enzyme